MARRKHRGADAGLPRRSFNLKISASKLKRGGVINALLIIGVIVAFLLVPLVITRSIIYLQPEQAIGMIALLGAIVVVLLPLHERKVNTRPYFYLMLAYVAFYICWPNYVAIQLPAIPFITPARVVLIALIGTWLFMVATARSIHDRLWSRLRPLAPIWIGLLIELCFRVLAIPYSVNPNIANKGLLDGITSLLIPMMIGLTLVETERDIRLLMKTIVVCAFAIGFPIIYEAATHSNPYIKYLAPMIHYSGRWLDNVLNPLSRYGHYRAQGPFMVHLSMAEFYLSSIPFALYLFEKAKGLGWKSFYLGAVFLAMFCIWAADSRTSMIVGGMIIGLYALIHGVLFSIRNPNSDVRPVVMLFIACMVMIIPLGVAYGLHHMDWRNAYGDAGTRAIQIRLAIPKILARPIIGYGAGLAGLVLDYRSNGRDPTIDNYYLSVVLDSGIPGLLAFVTVVFTLCFVSFRNAIKPGPHASLYLAFFLYFLCFAIVRFTLSEASNMTLTYMVMGVFIAMHSMLNYEAPVPEPEAVPDNIRRRRIWRLARQTVRGA